MGAPYIYDISRLRVKDLHSATYIYVVRRLRVKYPVRSISNATLLNDILSSLIVSCDTVDPSLVIIKRSH